MRMPASLETLVDYGVIQEVVRPLMSGKEAQVYLVISEGEERVAKVYKEAQARTFKHRAEYTEGRKTRNTRDQRAINKRTRHGRAQDEAAWRSTEADMIHRLRDAGVRVPEPHQFIDGVLVMELIKDAEGHPAPRLGDLSFEPKRALEIYDALIAEVVRMLCAGVVHGDLSEFNVLMGADGPAMIDLPQAVDPASNQNARRLLLRDVENLHRFVARFAPDIRRVPYAEEMWELYQKNRLRPTTKLTGGYRAPKQKADTAEVLALIADAREEERARRGPTDDEAVEPEFESVRPFRKVVDLTDRPPKPSRGRRGAGKNAAKNAGKNAGSAGRKKKAGRRRRRGSGTVGGEQAPAGAPARSAAPMDDDRPRRKRGRSKRRATQRGDGSGTARAGQASSAESDQTSPAKSGGASRNASSKPRAVGAKKRVRRRRRPGAKRPSPSEV